MLEVLNARQPAVAAWKGRPAPPPYFRAGVAFYPGCIDSLRGSGGYATAAPLTLFVGGADDWTAPGPCIDLAGRLAAAGEPVTLVVYADAHHGFDGPSAQKPLQLAMPNGVNPGKGVTVAPNPAAREDAYARAQGISRAELEGSQGAGEIAQQRRPQSDRRERANRVHSRFATMRASPWAPEKVRPACPYRYAS